MEKIASFTIDHIKLEPGVYVSRKDTVGSEVITTFDLRMTSPNDEPVMNTAEVHTIEHLGATFLRNHPLYKDKTIYFGLQDSRITNSGFTRICLSDSGMLPSFSSPRRSSAAISPNFSCGCATVVSGTFPLDAR